MPGVDARERVHPEDQAQGTNRILAADRLQRVHREGRSGPLELAIVDLQAGQVAHRALEQIAAELGAAPRWVA